MFKCTVCGYIHDGEEAPANCPKCGSPKEKFEKLGDEAASLVQKSRLTNDLHMHLIALFQEIEAIAQDGMSENLDPNCVTIFEKARKCAGEMVGSIMAELSGHVKKEKWG